jgi:Sap, sulfolipid-1-addressing protein
VGEAIGQALPFAVAIMLNPTASIAVLFVLSSPRGRTNGAAFLGGWLVSLAATGAALLLLVDRIDATEGSEPATWVSLLLLVLGVVLLVLAFKQWRGRPRKGDAPKPAAKWMSAFDRFTPLKAAGAAVLLGGLNPKNLLLILAGVAIIAEAGVSTGGQVGALGAFVVVASLGVALPVVLSLTLGARSQPMLEGLKEWFTHNSNVIMTVILIIFGATLIGDGISGLTV